MAGGAGTDRVNDGAGADLIFGGGDADTFVYTATNHSTTATRDRINDFRMISDMFDLSGIDANTLVAGNQAFSLIGTAFTAAGQLRVVGNGADTFVLGDVDGDGMVDLNIQVAGVVALGAGDFVL